MKDVSRRIQRLLYLVPFVAKRSGGVPVDELMELLDIDRELLLKDLDILCQVGPPDGDPGEYLLVSVEDGRVYVDLPQRLTRPLRLTPAESCGLLLGLRALRVSGIAPFDDALESAENKLLKTLGRDAEVAQTLATKTVVAQPDKSVSEHLKQLVTSARKMQCIEIDYTPASRNKAESRAIDPYGIVHHAGEWYLVGHCHKRGDTRTFRIDRIAAVRDLEGRFVIPDGFDLETYRREHLYLPSADAIAVTVSLDPLATARVGATWPIGNVSSLANGHSQIIIDCEGFEWITGWVLGMGKHAKITGPDEAIDAMRSRISGLKALLP